MDMKNIAKQLFLLTCLLSLGSFSLYAGSYTVDLKVAGAEGSPSIGTLQYSTFKAKNATTDGYKFAEVDDYVAWKLPTTSSETITAASFSGYINSSNKTYTFGYAFSTDGGSTWGTEKTMASDGTKKESTYNIPTADIPSGANAIKVIRKVNTRTLICSISITTSSSGGSVTPTPTTNPTITAFAVAGVNATIDQTAHTITATLPAGTNVTSLTPTVSISDADNYTPTGAQNFSSPVVYTVTKGTTSVNYTVTLTVAASPVNPDEPVTPTVNPTISSFAVAGVNATIDQTVHTITATLPAGTSLTSLTPTVQISDADSYSPTGAQNFTNPVSYTVTKGTTSVNYTVNLTVTATPVTPTEPDEPVVTPATSLKLHEQEVYEGSEYQGGYATPLVSYNNRQYEVYYVAGVKNASKSRTWSITTTNGGTYNVVDVSDATITETSTHARDGWFSGTSNGMSGNADISSGAKVEALEEFGGVPAEVKMINNNSFELYVKGYDEFRLYAKDNNTTESKEIHFEVYIDNVKQAMTLSSTANIRSFSMTQDAHLIRVVAIGTSNNYFYGFSLRLSNLPRVKYLAGNDSDQVVVQESAISPVRYTIRNNVTYRLDWVGATGTGFSLTPVNTAGDTIELTGTAQCPVGTYTYKVVALDAAGTAVSSCSGKFKVETRVYAPADGTAHTVWINDAMTPIVYTYGALNDDDVTFQWTTTPAGVTIQQDKNNNTWTIGGTPTTEGTFNYTITAAGGNTLNGTLTVDVPSPMFITPADSIAKVKATQSLVPVVWTVKFAKSVSVTGLPTGLKGTFANGQYTISGTPAVESSYPKTYTYTLTAEPLYTGKNQATAKGQIIVIDPSAKAVLYLYSDEYKDGVYTYLNGKNYDLTARPAEESVRDAQSYTAYNVVIISEDVDANNGEALSLARGEVAIPVLNMKSFLYTTSRLGWGFPDNGSVATTDLTVLQPSHPVFRGLQAKEGATLSILSEVKDKHGLMPVSTNLAGSIALATAPCRGENYYSDGDQATFLHEIPTTMRSSKYILFPIGQSSTEALSATGKKLLDNIMSYLLDATSSFSAPELRITGFRINGDAATIDEAAQTITLIVPDGTDLTALTPDVSVLSTGTWTEPNNGEEVDFSDTHFGVNYTVTDGINVKVYNVIVRTATGVDEINEDGLWFDGITLHNDMNVWATIYDVAGRKVATTNADYSFMALPNGLYLVQTAGSTLRVLR